jgi:cytochrome c55X
MNGFGGEGSDALTSEGATAVISFLRYQVQEHTVESVAVGRDLYVGNCLACHGTSGDRVASVELASASFLTDLGDGPLVSAIAGGTETGPAFGTAEGGAFDVPDTAALVAYLKSWAGLSATAALSSGSNTGLVGEPLFVQNCAPCHGPAGDNVAGVQLKSATFLEQKTRGVVTGTIQVGNDKGMPAWSIEAGGSLTDEQIESVVDFLYSSAGVEGGAAVSDSGGSGGGTVSASPFGDRSPAEFFGANCAGCHGADRSGGLGPPLLPDVLTEPDDFYIDTILNGRPGTPMPVWSDQGVTEEQAAALVNFVKGNEPASADAPSDGGDGSGGGADANAPIFDGQTPAEFFAANCAACHGADRTGGIGPALLPETLTEPADFYVDTILNGRPGTPMPVWSDQGVTEEQAAAMVAYLTASEDAASAAPEGGDDAALFAGQTAAEFFGSNCAACHGADRSGGLGPALLPDRLTEADDFYVNTILNGRPGTPMPVWGDQGVTEEQAAALVEFIKSDPNASASSAPSGGATTTAIVNTGERLFGQALFENTCALCHGKDGLQVPQCPLGNPEWIANMSYEGLVTRISRGKPSQGMPTWSDRYGGPLTDAQIASVANYVAAMSRSQ